MLSQAHHVIESSKTRGRYTGKGLRKAPASPQGHSSRETHFSRQARLLNVTVVVIDGLLGQQHAGEHLLARLLVHIRLKSEERLRLVHRQPQGLEAQRGQGDRQVGQPERRERRETESRRRKIVRRRGAGRRQETTPRSTAKKKSRANTRQLAVEQNWVTTWEEMNAAFSLSTFCSLLVWLTGGVGGE